MITAKVYLDGNLLDTYVADAVLISTPTGSTAYNLSASGPVLSPDMQAMIITPICPHSLNKRSLVVSSQAKLRIEIGRTKEKYEDEAAVLGDGQRIGTVTTGDVIWIEKARETFDMVRLGEISFFDKMRSKLNRD
jgi:NAD+ kinase